MGSSPSSPSEGCDWKGEVYFDPDAGSTSGYAHRYEDCEIREKLTNKIGENEKITDVYVYDHPLHAIQVTKILMKHTYVVLETDAWWWSIEKNSEGITIQRSKELADVRDKYRQKGRTTGIRGITKAISDSARSGVKLSALVEWLWKQDVLNDKYHWDTSNCQHFAKKLFNWVSASKTYTP